MFDVSIVIDSVCWSIKIQLGWIFECISITVTKYFASCQWLNGLSINDFVMFLFVPIFYWYKHIKYNKDFLN